MALAFMKKKRANAPDKQIASIRQNSQAWHLATQDIETLERLRDGLTEALKTVEDNLKQASQTFTQFIESGQPLPAEQAQEEIDYWGAKWESLYQQQKALNERLQERYLFRNLSTFLGSEQRARFLEIAVLCLIVIVVGLIMADLFLPLPPQTLATIRTLDLSISILLIIEFFLRLSLADSKSWFWRRYWIDLAASIPFQELLRFGRLARLARFARLIRLLRFVRVILFIFRGADKLFATFNLILLKRSLMVTLALLIVGAISISAFEGGNDSAMQSLSQGLWWSFATVVTGGYADIHDPESVPGRIVTVGLVLLGLTVTGIFTASLTSVLVDDDSSQLERNQRSMDAKLNDVQQRLELMASATNEGLVALETVSQALSNQTSSKQLAAILADTLIHDFSAVQVRLYLLNSATADSAKPELTLHYEAGELTLDSVDQAQPYNNALSVQTVARLSEHASLAEVDLEPETELGPTPDYVTMVCPLVAALRIIGTVQIVLPSESARYYLYNRVPMTLAHQAALAFHALDC